MKKRYSWISKSGTLLLLGILLIPVSGGSARADTPPSLNVSTARDRPLFFCGEAVPLDRREIWERLEKELLLSLWNRPQVLLWLKRSTRYLPHIEAVLKENALPDDLKYMAIAESALRPHAASRKGAVGFWQFMPETGRKYGLRVDQWKDERRNLFSATDAAVRYLTFLYQEYGSWTLAAAAYNMGEEGLTTAMLAQQTGDYYRLYLPSETQRYLFRILSIKIIFSDPAAYGFHLAQDGYYPPLLFDRTQVTCERAMPVRIIARAANTYFKQIKDLNPEIRGNYLDKGVHTVLLPQGSGGGFEAAYMKIAGEYLASTTERLYVVKQGDSLSLIARKFDVSLSALMTWNRIDMNRPIHPGDRLVVHVKKGQVSDTP
jgi:hypothetical protein